MGRGGTEGGGGSGGLKRAVITLSSDWWYKLQLTGIKGELVASASYETTGSRL